MLLMEGVQLDFLCAVLSLVGRVQFLEPLRRKDESTKLYNSASLKENFKPDIFLIWNCDKSILSFNIATTGTCTFDMLGFLIKNSIRGVSQALLAILR